MQVKKHILYENGKPVLYRQTPNLHKGALVPLFIVAHYDGASNDESAVNWLTQKGSGVSAHLHIDREGDIVQMARFDQKTWHAGKSAWKGYTSLNQYSIGIEMQNMGGQVYTEIQIEKFIAVSKALDKAYNIRELLGHDQVATPAGRKVDPGKQFPMSLVRERSSIQAPVLTTANLNLRLNPSTLMPVLDVLGKGTEVDVLWEGDGWAEVFVESKNLRGWVSSKYIKS